MIFFKKALSVIYSAVFIFILSLSGQSVLATTGDDGTPANEGVCDVLSGATKGLYGLCVAYCEAQDLDIIGDKETPNNKILKNYRKKMQIGDPDMPCLKVECPCWSAEELAAVTASAVTSASCTISDSVALLRNAAPTQFASASLTTPLCRFTDTAAVPRISRRFSGEDAMTTLQAEACYTQIVNACAGLPAP